jgi:hypothetical protein
MSSAGEHRGGAGQISWIGFHRGSKPNSTRMHKRQTRITWTYMVLTNVYHEEVIGICQEAQAADYDLRVQASWGRDEQ